MIPWKPCCERNTYNKISFWPFLIPLSFSFIFPTSPITFYTTQTIFWLQNSILPLSVHHYVWVPFSLNVWFFIFFSLSSSSILVQSFHAIPGMDSKQNRFRAIKNRREWHSTGTFECYRYGTADTTVALMTTSVHRERGREGYQKGFIHAERHEEIENAVQLI